MRISGKDLRVYLSALGIGDAERIQFIANDYDIAYNMPSMPFPYERTHAISFVGLAAQKYISREEYHMGIRLLNDDLVGLCALSNMDLNNKKAELGYWIGKDYWGKGYAKEAIRLMLSFGFKELGLNKIYAKVLTYNERSIKLLESLKFYKESTNREDVLHMGMFLDDFTFSMLRKDYREYNEIVFIK